MDSIINFKNSDKEIIKVKKRNFNGSISYKDKNKTNKACYDFTTKNWKFTNYNI